MATEPLRESNCAIVQPDPRLTYSLLNSLARFDLVRAVSAELIGILSVCVALAGPVLRLTARIDGIEDRLASVEQRLAQESKHYWKELVDRVESLQ